MTTRNARLRALASRAAALRDRLRDRWEAAPDRAVLRRHLLAAARAGALRLAVARLPD